MDDTFIPTAALQRWVEQLWLAAGCSTGEARLTAERTIDAQERWEHLQKQQGD